MQVCKRETESREVHGGPLSKMSVDPGGLRSDAHFWQLLDDSHFFGSGFFFFSFSFTFHIRQPIENDKGPVLRILCQRDLILISSRKIIDHVMYYGTVDI
jgi:hypothetical protein